MYRALADLRTDLIEMIAKIFPNPSQAITLSA